MKKFLFIVLLFTANSTLFAQANVTSSAISVQGIARNDQNNAVANSSVSVTAELLYYNASAPTTPVTILSRTGNVTTDAFGVFAYVVDIGSSDFVKISNSEAWIKISSNNIVFAQEKLMTVPYSVHAQNGAPTGSIMPYVGSTAPAGWLLCDGTAIPSGDAYTALKTMLGNATNVPDLRGMFIRGAGTNGVNTYANNVGPALRAIQGDGVKDHVHPFTSNSATTSSNGAHNHTVYLWRGGNVPNGTAGASLRADWEIANANDEFAYSVSGTGNHTHAVTVTGTTNNNTSGVVETRPVNYGVSYIIKI